MRKVSVFIGRFQPFHKGHYKIVKKALEQTDYLVMVLGSHNKAVNTRDPLTSDERIQIIHKSLSDEEFSRIRFVKVEDYAYNLDRWISGVRTAVNSAKLPWYSGRVKYYLTGMKKDHSSFYLNMFPNWESITILPDDIQESIGNITYHLEQQSATHIRNTWYESEEADDFVDQFDSFGFVNYQARDLFIEFMEKKTGLKKEFEYEQNYEKQWGKGPHLTVDAAVVQAGHLLLIQRGAEYGHNLWALPGGFVNRYETTFDACVRELYEETAIKIPQKVMRGSVGKVKLYDDPYRSNRGRIVTNAFHFRLSDVGPLPKVKGSDDADYAAWIPLDKVLDMRDEMFEDHYDMILDLLNL